MKITSTIVLLLLISFSYLHAEEDPEVIELKKQIEDWQKDSIKEDSLSSAEIQLLYDTLGKVDKNQKLVDVKEFGEILGYPADSLVLRDITGAERHLYGDGVIYACRIDSKVADSFLPFIITAAKSGTFQEKFPLMMENMKEIDSLRDKPNPENIMVPFGKLALGVDIVGGLYLMQSKIMEREGITINDRELPITYIYLNMASKGIEIRIAQLEAIYKVRTRVPGDEHYFKLNQTEFQPSYEERVAVMSWIDRCNELRKLFILLARLIIDSPFVQNYSSLPATQSKK